MKVFGLFFALCSTLAFAEPPPGKWPTQVEAQRELDSFFSQADHVVFSEIVGARESFTPILTISTPDEITQISRCFRLLIDDSEEVVEVDGRWHGRYVVRKCGCYGWFRMELYRDGVRVLDVYLHHGKSLACSMIRSEGLIDL